VQALETSSNLDLDGKLQIHVEVDRISYRNEDNGWTVLRARDTATQRNIVVTGAFPTVREGEHYQLIGNWDTHQTYGEQFKIERSVPTRPTTRAGVLRYLGSGLIKGIGEKTADRIVEHFGLDTFKILDQNPGLILQVPGIGKRKAKEIVEGWREQKAVGDVLIFLHTHGISPTFAQRILKAYGPDAVEVISQNPYQLAADIRGIGFTKADAIARSIGINAEAPERLRAAIIYFMKQAEERGHCFVTIPQLSELSSSGLDIPQSRLHVLLPAQMEALADSGAVLEESLNGDPIFFRPQLLAAEATVAEVMSRLVDSSVDMDRDRIRSWIAKYSAALSQPLSEEQTQAVEQAAMHRVFILTGGPGVGKTTTANGIIRLFKAIGRSVALAAPTGRAAQRLSEVAAEKAKTIHRLLEWNAQAGHFDRGASNPLSADVVICDEVSMLDILLAESLVSALPEHAQLVMIGDVDQLPSVGPGCVLKDLIDSGVIPVARLNQIFRQSANSMIVQNAHSINKGLMPQFSPNSDCVFIEADGHDEVRRIITDLLTEVLPKRYNIDPVRDVQILTPVNRGDLGTQNLNIEIQKLLNPDNDSSRVFANDFEIRKNDKVIQTSNNYELSVFNGDIGFVQSTRVDGGKMLVAFGEDRAVAYTDDQADDLRLAYAITIHKSQGSEFPVVILPLTMQHFVMLQRNLIYTGLTRAKRLAIFVGSTKALQTAVQRTTIQDRQTTLRKRLQEVAR
jgi:exodeoxyribonuclease V alpha subunit